MLEHVARGVRLDQDHAPDRPAAAGVPRAPAQVVGLEHGNAPAQAGPEAPERQRQRRPDDERVDLDADGRPVPACRERRPHADVGQAERDADVAQQPAPGRGVLGQRPRQRGDTQGEAGRPSPETRLAA